MSKSKRLLELMLTVNQKRTFTVRELADEFGVSKRTILRDLQELSELGVPLYSEVGPHGGYRMLQDRMLPPIAFSEEEAVAIFFAVHALRHYDSLPFEAETVSALGKFYNFMPQDTRDRIDQMKNRVDFITPKRTAHLPYLALLLDAAIYQKILHVEYQSQTGCSTREILPQRIYARNGLWYCSAYCFEKQTIRVFRCDQMKFVTPSLPQPKNPNQILTTIQKEMDNSKITGNSVPILADLTGRGVERCEAEPWSEPMLHIREDRTGWIEGLIQRNDLPYFANFFISLGKDISVKDSPALVAAIRDILAELDVKYERGKEEG
ncbi:YafY family protein [Paenibacillus sp. Marseille-Q4541]|uniref:helix-turn-helix transcriptional regulator n=1 Tax=Paenibacillus sp. Marseille-Q4541 TaxID=2831522 RepID=UPI001BA6408B|nr:YafY family protein [Paenibacillus sp. Marseille-Q4541]